MQEHAPPLRNQIRRQGPTLHSTLISDIDLLEIFRGSRNGYGCSEQHGPDVLHVPHRSARAVRVLADRGDVQ